MYYSEYTIIIIVKGGEKKEKEKKKKNVWVKTGRSSGKCYVGLKKKEESTG